MSISLRKHAAKLVAAALAVGTMASVSAAALEQPVAVLSSNLNSSVGTVLTSDQISTAEQALAKAKAEAEAAVQKIQAEAAGEKTRIAAEAEADATRIEAQAEADANNTINNSITDNLIRMKEAEARLEHGWVTVQGGSPVVTAD